MQQYFNAALLRFDTYLLEEDLIKQVSLLRDKSCAQLSEIAFDEINEQIVDVDSVADLHDTYIENILSSRKMYYLKNANFKGITVDIFLNRFFIAFYIRSQESHSIEDLIRPIETEYLGSGNLTTIYTSLKLLYSINRIPKNDIWNVCDRSAFPILEDTDYNGSYSDTIRRGDIDIDLTRDISPASPDGTLSDIAIQTMAVFPSYDLKEATPRIQELIALCKNEATRCFKY